MPTALGGHVRFGMATQSRGHGTQRTICEPSLLQQEAKRTMGKTFMPTPSQIQEACREIRKEWSPAEEQARRAWTGSGAVALRVVRIADVDGAAVRHSIDCSGQMD